MKANTWIRTLFFITFFGISFIILFNYLINPYNVFSHTVSTKYITVKDNLIDDEMSKFYAAYKKQPDTILVGSSRVEHINPEDLEKYTTGNSYNLGVKGSGLSTQYNLIKYFITKQKVKTVILGLDFFAFSPANIGKNNNIANTRYDNYYFQDYMSALLSFRTFRKSILTLKDNLSHKEARILWENGWDTYFHEYAIIDKISKDEYFHKIESAFPNFGLNDKFFANKEFKHPYSIHQGLDLLAEIVSLCKLNNVELKIFTTPIYHRVYDVIVSNGYLNTYNYWKQELSKYEMIYDFNYKNIITKNYENYVDASHFKADVGKLIFERMYQQKDVEFSEFGIILNSKTVHMTQQ